MSIVARRAGRAFFALAVLYLGVGHFLHRVVAPLPAPDPTTFPRAGDEFGSLAEGALQRVHAVTDGWVVSTMRLAAHAEGPPLHLHHGFAETFTPSQGVLHVQLGDSVVLLRQGDTLHVDAGTAHRPFNPGDTEVVFSSVGPAMPQSFAACLVQLYRVMDERGTNALTMMLQMSVIDPICDTHLAEVPLSAQKALAFLLAPAARLAGYRNYYPEYSLHPGEVASVEGATRYDPIACRAGPHSAGSCAVPRYVRGGEGGS